MKSIETINQELNEAIDALQAAQVKLKQLGVVKNTLDRLSEKKEKMVSQLEKEEKDVQKLMSFSLNNFVSTLLNNKAEKLSKEEQEALQAKRQLDQVVYEYNETKEQLESLYALEGKLPALERTYHTLIKEKKKYVQVNAPSQWLAIEKNDSDIEGYHYDNKEIKEAKEAGQQAIKKIDEALEVLNSAKSWGTYDMIGGGLLSSMVKHQKIDEAKVKLQGLNISLKNFENELDDTNISQKFEVRFDSGTKFVDMFFDNIFTDMSVQSKITDSIFDIENLKRQIQRIISDLIQKEASNKSRIIDLNARNLELLKNI